MSQEIARRWRPTITDSARPYLEIQQGRISDRRGPGWDEAYAAQLLAVVDSMREFVPQPLTGILDVGAGMGGIDAALVNALGTAETRVVLIDGLADKAQVVKPYQTYSDGTVALEFLRANGVPRSSILAYKPGDPIDPEVVGACQVDLVVSVQAWCFHFPAQLYCAVAMAMSRPGARWILDVRADQAAWAAYLFSTPGLSPIAELPGFNEKYTRMVFEVDHG